MQAQDTPRRKYALSKVKPGDYLLPSNDGQTVYRIAKYEDGPSHGLVAFDKDREFWGVWRWQDDVPLGPGSYVDVEDWNRWEFCEGLHDKRADAIHAALRIERWAGSDLAAFDEGPT
jgi:hypothetical protein